jgi:hypothetical protein
VRCDNPSCFLYGDVDRASRLDDFVRIGNEHGVGSLTGRGFPEETSPGDEDAVVAVAEVGVRSATASTGTAVLGRSSTSSVGTTSTSSVTTVRSVSRCGSASKS